MTKAEMIMRCEREYEKAEDEFYKIVNGCKAPHEEFKLAYANMEEKRVHLEIAKGEIC